MRPLSSKQKTSLEKMAEDFHRDLGTTELARPQLAYLVEERGLTLETLMHFRVGAVVNPEAYGDEEFAYRTAGRISIPFITPTGVVLIRYMEPPPRESGVKYWQPTGSYLPLFNTRVIAEGGRKLALVEGEIEAMTLHQLGIPAVAIAGASAWKGRHHYPAIFEGYDEIVFLADNDEADKFDEEGRLLEKAGERLARQIKEDLRNVRVVKWPKGHDGNSFYTQFGGDAVHELVQW